MWRIRFCARVCVCKPPLTEVILALDHLSDVDFGGSLWDLYDLVVADFGQAVLEQSRNQPTRCVVPAAHTTFIQHLV